MKMPCIDSHKAPQTITIIGNESCKDTVVSRTGRKYWIGKSYDTSVDYYT